MDRMEGRMYQLVHIGHVLENLSWEESGGPKEPRASNARLLRAWDCVTVLERSVGFSTWVGGSRGCSEWHSLHQLRHKSPMGDPESCVLFPTAWSCPLLHTVYLLNSDTDNTLKAQQHRGGLAVGQLSDMARAKMASYPEAHRIISLSW